MVLLVVGGIEIWGINFVLVIFVYFVFWRIDGYIVSFVGGNVLSEGKELGIIIMYVMMFFFFINVVECWEVIILCFVVNIFVIKVDFVGINIIKVFWLIVFLISRDLGIIFDINLIFVKL